MTGSVIAVTGHLRPSLPQTDKKREKWRGFKVTGIVIAVTGHLRPSFPQTDKKRERWRGFKVTGIVIAVTSHLRPSFCTISITPIQFCPILVTF